MRTGMELEHEQLVKGVNKCELEKKPVSCKSDWYRKKKRNIYNKRVHDFW